MKTVFVQSFGCRASQADGAAISASLEASGLARVATAGEADLVVINTCTVTHSADVDARRVLRGLKRDHPDARLLVTGCYAQRAPQELASIDGVDWVIGNSHKNRIAEIVAAESSLAYHGRVHVADLSEQFEFRATPVVDTREDRTRPNLKVQDGCSNRCSFCIIPSVRGRSRSAPMESVVSQVQDLAERYVEVVLSGINLGRWGRDLPGRLRFVDLLQAVLQKTTVQRLRISSVEPMDWSTELFELIASDPRIARHVHIPLQSGSDTVLKRMCRKYRTRHYASRLENAHRLIPDAAIGADVMTGFPGESDSEFAETVRFIEEHPFTYLHVFTYSERPGTAAAAQEDSVPISVRRERTQVLRDLGQRKNLAFRRGLVGKTLSAVTLERPGVALTTNFVNVQLARIVEPRRMVDVAIEGVSDTGVVERSLFPIVQEGHAAASALLSRMS